jgi:ABC-type multidrug transport system fused ATPase/permease subunit
MPQWGPALVFNWQLRAERGSFSMKDQEYLDDPGEPLAGRSPFVSVLGWLAAAEARNVMICCLLSTVFLMSQQAIPLAIGNIIDLGLRKSTSENLGFWITVLALAVLLSTVTGIMAHRYELRLMLEVSFRAQKRLVNLVARIGSALPYRVRAGEAVSVSAADAGAFGMFVSSLGMFVASIVSFVAVALILALYSWTLAAVVVIGVPATILVLRPIFTRVEALQGVRRERLASQTGVASDAVMGMRVLRGIGGEARFAERYRELSGQTREAGISLGNARAILRLAQVAVPGAMILTTVWIGARMASEGTLSGGEFASLTGYIIFLTRPVSFIIAGIDWFSRSKVAADRFQNIEDVAKEHQATSNEPIWPSGEALSDPRTGISIAPGRITGLVFPQHDDSEKRETLDRLAGYGQNSQPAKIGDLDLARFSVDTLRSRIHLLDSRTHLLSGTVRDQLNHDGRRSEREIIAALKSSGADEVVAMNVTSDRATGETDADYDLDQSFIERGRNFSGGERQRFQLARAFLTTCDYLVLDEPASACDKQTESRMAEGIASLRNGRTVVLATASPVLLGICDDVVHVNDASKGRV